MTKQARDRELRKSKITRDASKGVAQNVQCDVVEVRLPTDPVENPHDTDEMSVAPVSREHEGRALPPRCSFDARHRSLADNPDLSAALRVRETDTMVSSANPTALQPQHLHTTKPRPQHQSDGG